ncbi:cation:dicarboxylate symporter family transporter [Endozoicomonas sp. SCSIO W0465]|uniref:cation:dicarboxylate symporter family transporter n=1 Tax=Endozoicomonas sp. SCSIO W0465 TaxID=2918516 RepID=UPI0020759578|nr:cation:dicarboxylase symporter family transporter [Endozoicomonas sp. SCSIO W0465]USE39049.1 dicarboxylate/amino acid:cation symporter [Endozoicomonas sp. SCSIO W0465]
MNIIEYLVKVKLPAMLLIVLFIPVLTDSWVSYDVKSFFFSLSLTIKTLLVFVLPFIVFSFVVTCLARMGKNALLFTLLLIGMVFASNIAAIFTGYTIGSIMVPLISMPVIPDALDGSGLAIMWVFERPPLLTNMNALIVGFIAGMLVNLLDSQPLRELCFRASDFSGWFLKHIFIPILPFFILGFAFKLHADGILRQAISAFGPIMLLVIVSQLAYLFIYFFVAAKLSLRDFLTYVGNVFPAWLTGLSTVSSAASMPVLIDSTEKNIGNPIMARTIVPATINIHTIGSAIGLTILALVTLNTFNLPMPDLQSFAIFGFYYALAKFSVAAVPGGVILVVGPILQSLMGFSDEMLGLITAVYMIFDPFGTAMNVSGNGAFAILFSRLCQCFGINGGDDDNNEDNNHEPESSVA